MNDGSPAPGSRRLGWSVVVVTAVNRLEVVVVAPLRDLAPDRHSLFVGVPEVDSRPDPRVDDLVDCVREARVASGDSTDRTRFGQPDGTSLLPGSACGEVVAQSAVL